MKYDVIGKVETFAEDFAYLQSISGLGKHSYTKHVPEFANSVPHSADRGRRYFAELDYQRRKDLFQLYKPDFDMFDYEAESYGVATFKATS